MKHTVAILFALLSCIGCGRDHLSSTNSVPEKAPPAATSERYPKLEWTEAVPEREPGASVPTVIAAHGGTDTVSVPVLRRRFEDRRWTEAKDPEFTIWLTENDFFHITMAPDSKKMVGTVKITTMIDSGPMRGEVSQVEIRTTQPFANEGEALSLLEAYLKQDGTFDTLVRWTDAETGDSDADEGERSP